jgi:hypothetical protein
LSGSRSAAPPGRTTSRPITDSPGRSPTADRVRCASANAAPSSSRPCSTICRRHPSNAPYTRLDGVEEFLGVGDLQHPQRPASHTARAQRGLSVGGVPVRPGMRGLEIEHAVDVDDHGRQVFNDPDGQWWTARVTGHGFHDARCDDRPISGRIIGTLRS